MAALERDFDGYEYKCSKSVSYMRGGWKEAAQALSREEMPQLVKTGQESGPFPGFADSIYLDADRVRREGLEAVKTFHLRPALVWPDGRWVTRSQAQASAQACSSPRRACAKLCGGGGHGRWKTDLDLRKALMAENPLLPRSSVLCAASGRYSKDLVVPGGHRTATNPQGDDATCRGMIAPERDSILIWLDADLGLCMTRQGGAGG